MYKKRFGRYRIRRAARKRYVARRRKLRLFRAPSTRVMNYKREFFKQQVGGGGGGIALSFKLTDLPNSAAFSTMFDQYRIMAVVLKYVPYITANATMTAGDVFNANHVIGMDFNDAIAPGSSDDVYKLKYHKTFALCRYFNYKVKPRTEQSLYNTALTTGYGNASRKVWIDTASGSIPYYGLKLYITNASIAVPFIGELYLTYYCQFRNINL